MTGFEGDGTLANSLERRLMDFHLITFKTLLFSILSFSLLRLYKTFHTNRLEKN